MTDNSGKDNVNGGLKTASGFFSVWKIMLPVFIGLAVVVVMFLHDSDVRTLPEVLSGIRFDGRVIACILLSLLAFFGRDFGLTWRFRILTDNELKWRYAAEVDMLCEFASCVTPSAVGGSSLGMIFLNSRGIELGRATTLMMTTLLLDELFFVVLCPVVVSLVPGGMLFDSGDKVFADGLRLSFWLIYGVITLWALVLFLGTIWRPKMVSTLIRKMFRWRILRRWHSKADSLADNMVATSHSLRRRSFSFWLKAFSATALSWLSRFAAVNVLFFGFIASADPMQWLIFARQFVIWVVLMLSPTPGGSGLSEWLFSSYYGDLVSTAGMALLLAVLWRMISYYVYLVIGAFVVPGWIKNTYRKLHGK